MKELDNNKLNEVSGGTGIGNGGFKVGDWVVPNKMKLSPGTRKAFFRIDDIEQQDTSMPIYVVNKYKKDHIDGSISKFGSFGKFLAEELDYANDPTFSPEFDL